MQYCLSKEQPTTGYVGLQLRDLYIIRDTPHKDSRSVGAVAGLAIAILFTWRLLRSPSGPQRRQPKRQAPTSSSSGVSNHSNTNLTSSGVCSPSEDSRAQNVIDEFFQPVKPTLGQIVRQKLSEGRKVTCRLLGVILEETSPEELQVKQATVRSSVLEVLLEITKFCDLYLMERVLDDESEKKVLLALEDAGVFTSGGLVKDKAFTIPMKGASFFHTTCNGFQGRTGVGSSDPDPYPKPTERTAAGVGEGCGNFWFSKGGGGGSGSCGGEISEGVGGGCGGCGEGLWVAEGGCGWGWGVVEGFAAVVAGCGDVRVWTEIVLFCGTENGRTSFVRQLEPDWHIDSNPDIVYQLARFIKYQLHISPIKPERTAANVFSSPALEQFFGCV
ncbi:hypothetical protein TEA_018750 [Camellia sinensis var. sinensis]|uniref:Peroxisome biogenesis protein 22 n=1 Tax=Camellia sinensis var. sinensis TaxID=542762 RepID=A0A4S4CZA1_CAMSN|nr:hypothetical protein TEA_018750 [Camellia sinensis var. sinensis]